MNRQTILTTYAVVVTIALLIVSAAWVGDTIAERREKAAAMVEWEAWAEEYKRADDNLKGLLKSMKEQAEIEKQYELERRNTLRTPRPAAE